jgi:hypothetical protein
MIERSALRILVLVLSSQLVLPLYSADKTGSDSPQASPASSATSELGTNVLRISPGPADGRIAFVTARMLEQLHYSRQPLDRSVGSKFLDRYLETLDPQHLHFTQADLAEFQS